MSGKGLEELFEAIQAKAEQTRVTLAELESAIQELREEIEYRGLFWESSSANC